VSTPLSRLAPIASMLVLLCLCVAAVCGVSAAQAVTLYVAVSGSDADNNCSVAAKPCRSLPVALNVARDLERSVVVVVELSAGDYGSWSCGGLSDRDMTLAGVGGVVDIDCGGVDRLLRVVNSTVHVRDVVVRNGRAVVSRVVCDDDNEPEGGGAVSIEWGDDTPRAAVFTNVMFAHCSVESAHCGAYGGAVNARFGSNARITFNGCSFLFTSAEVLDGGVCESGGGAINLRMPWSSAFTTNVSVTIEKSSFESTHAFGWNLSTGGAVSFSGGRNVSEVQFTIADSSFTNATVGSRFDWPICRGGAVSVTIATPSGIQASNATFTFNNDDFSWCSCWCSGFRDCISPGGVGGAVHIRLSDFSKGRGETPFSFDSLIISDVQVLFRGSTFTHNTGVDGGGALVEISTFGRPNVPVANCSVVFERCSVIGNSALAGAAP
jgi:hypothetical protein